MDSLQFREKILTVQDNLFSFALLLTGNRSDAYDLLQDTTLKALDSEDKYISNVNFRGWVLTIMRNLFINNYRKVVRTQTILDQAEDLYHINLPHDSGFDTPESFYTVKEINNAIEGLDKDLQTPFLMLLAGYKYNEIVDELGIPLGTIKSRIFLARRELQRHLHSMR